jgi:hypothetical protein
LPDIAAISVDTPQRMQQAPTFPGGTRMSAHRFAPLLILALAATPLLANAAPKTAQQELMAKCSAQNKGKTGEDYKSSQKACLSSGKTDSNAKVSPQQRMKDCNAEAATKKLSGDARKTFMSGCLKTH